MNADRKTNPTTDSNAHRQTSRWHNRPTIGLLGSPLHRHQSLWLGAAEAAQELDANLFIFLGGAVMTEQLKATVLYGMSGVESAAVLYDLANVDNLDGLVTWAGVGAGLGIHLNQEEMEAFLQRYRTLPIVNYEKVIEGIPCILTDTYQGMREVVAHLIEGHHCRRIALMRGPAGHFESEERLQAYVDTLAAYNLAYDPALIGPPAAGWGMEYGAEAMRQLLDDRQLRPGLDFDAVVTTDLAYVMGAVEELRARGVQVPGDVAAAGFNDLPEARASIPSLTAMRKPFYESGYQAVAMLLDLIQGKPVPELVQIPARLMIRRSCGCWPPEIQQIGQHTPASMPEGANAQAALPLFSTVLIARREEFLADIRRGVAPLVPAAQADTIAANLLDALITEFPADPACESALPHHFLSALEAAIQSTSSTGGEVEQWHLVLSELYGQVRPYLTDDDRARLRIVMLWQQARVMVQQEVQRLDLAYNLNTVWQALTLREVGKRLISTFDIAELMDALALELPRLGIPSCYLALYENPQVYQYPQAAPEWSRLMLAYNANGRIELGPGGRRFSSRQLIPDGLLPQDKPYVGVVVPLYFGQQQFGFALFEAGPKNGMIYTELWQLVSSALQVLSLLEERLALAVERERVAILADFIRDAAHEFRTPLSVINNSLYLLGKPSSPERHAEQLNALTAQAQYINELVEAMLTMSRLDSTNKLIVSPFDLAGLLAEIKTRISPLADDKQIILTFVVDGDIPPLVGDEHELHQAISHIVRNAVQFMPDGGTITVRASTMGHTVVVEVADTGIGIGEADLPHIFNRFFRADRARTGRGAGLGLAIAKRVIEAHQGTIEVESTLGKGSTFRIVLPLHTPDSPLTRKASGSFRKPTADA